MLERAWVEAIITAAAFLILVIYHLAWMLMGTIILTSLLYRLDRIA
jgi:hypothetical protein